MITLLGSEAIRSKVLPFDRHMSLARARIPYHLDDKDSLEGLANVRPRCLQLHIPKRKGREVDLRNRGREFSKERTSGGRLTLVLSLRLEDVEKVQSPERGVSAKVKLSNSRRRMMKK